VTNSLSYGAAILSFVMYPDYSLAPQFYEILSFPLVHAVCLHPYCFGFSHVAHFAALLISDWYDIMQVYTQLVRYMTSQTPNQYVSFNSDFNTADHKQAEILKATNLTSVNSIVINKWNQVSKIY
jgi:hypothetical protein